MFLPRPGAVHPALGRDKVEVAQQLLLRAFSLAQPGDLGGHGLPRNHCCVFREAPRGRRRRRLRSDDPDGLAAELAAKVRRELRGAVVIAAATDAAGAAGRG